MPTVELTGAQHRSSRCGHTRQAHAVTPSGEGCEECVKLGDPWAYLRVCMSCGRVGCCNASNKHATQHYSSTAHPLARSFEPGEAWAYCYREGTTL